MSYGPSPAQIEWHMHLLRQCAPAQLATPPDASQDYHAHPQDYPIQHNPSYCQRDFDVYSMQVEPDFFTHLRRAHTTTCFPDLHFGSVSQDPMTPMSCSAGDMTAFDDGLSIYSDAPSSYLSSEYSEGPNFDDYPPNSTPSIANNSSETPRAGNDVAPATEIDALMMTLQPEPYLQVPSCQSHSGKIKKHNCPFPGCYKSFSQLTHLKIHHRAHTGEKPYTCSIPNCGQSFSQLGNLRTHERRHAGQRPNRSRAHSASAGRYECRLDGCAGKPFTQLGNLKSHQNKFHKQTLLSLSQQFAYSSVAEGEAADSAMTVAERELRNYFVDLYKNSNKGIKGRGKGRKVEVVLAQSL